jgi:Carboxypeptidase regulatory-like domain
MKLAAAVLAVLASVAPAAAEDITATLTGMVADNKGRGLPGVTVSVKNTATGLHKEVVTSATGLYTASFLDAGRYEVSVALEGFKTRVVKKVQLRARDRRQLDVVLKPGGAKDPPR